MVYLENMLHPPDNHLIQQAHCDEKSDEQEGENTCRMVQSRGFRRSSLSCCLDVLLERDLGKWFRRVSHHLRVTTGSNPHDDVIRHGLTVI